jgi:hypothetical protein
MKILLTIAALILLVGCDKFPKVAADAYICGEPPKQDTFYCKTGTGPPRDDCGIAQPGEFQGVDVITC